MKRDVLLGAILFAILAAGVRAGGADIERDARDLEARLIAPCCFSQQVSVHQSPAAGEMRQDIRRRLAAGETTEEILAAYTAQYGKRVLAQPPAEGFDRLLYLLPPLGLVLTAGLVVAAVRRFTSRRRANVVPEHPEPSGTGDKYSAQLDEQLRDLD